MAKIPQTRDELEAQLAEQVGFLERSAESFDRGFDGEYKRLALSVRVLVHDTKMSRSLFSQLGIKGRPFVDLGMEFSPENILSSDCLTYAIISTEEAIIRPLLDTLNARMVSFEEWWGRTVIRDNARREFSRRDLILTAANQDGGGHVDPALDEAYSDLSRRNSLGWNFRGAAGDNPVTGHEKVSIRHIAHEILRFLKAQ